MQRRHYSRDGLTLSYLDAGGEGPVLIALPAHWMEGATYAALAQTLAPDWRVVALDQRGHGHSDHAPREGGYTREAYLEDIAELLRHLEVESAVLLGNSLGGVNAYQFAARYPRRVRALVVEDIEAEVTSDTSFCLAWAGTFPTREALAERVGPRFTRYLEDAFRETPAGWRLAFDPEDMVASQRQLNGDHWQDWLASRCPALLLRGRQSRVTTPAMVEEMAARRPGTRLVTLDAGHVIHLDDPEGFTRALRSFLCEIARVPHPAV